MSVLRPYQRRAVAEVRARWAAGASAVCLVAPTGAGKTRLGEELLNDARPALWVAHRRELVRQTSLRLASRFGTGAIGEVMPGSPTTKRARVQVATVQTLLASEARPPATTIVLDEAHHYMASEWRRLLDAYPLARVVGLTATPERLDGEPLGDIFNDIVVAATYSELLSGGFLVSARVYAPRERLGNDLALDPVDAWHRYSEGSQAFVFCSRVAIAEDVAARFRDAGIATGTITAQTPTGVREDRLARFRSGTLRVLTNVNTLTEGVDVPEARTVILARAFGHVGGYLQAAGRVLRPSRAKPDAIVIDLAGSTLKHGLPTMDRTYSLDGRAISGAGTFGGGGAAPPFVQNVRGVELQMLARGALAPEAAPAVVGRRQAQLAEAREAFERTRAGAPASFARMRHLELAGGVR